MVMSICSYNLTIHYIPNIVYAVFHYKIEKNQNIKDNEIKHFDIPSDQSRNVVMPNPDFLYSTAIFSGEGSKKKLATYQLLVNKGGGSQ